MSVTWSMHAYDMHMLLAGDAHSAALTTNGFLFMWGSNEKGQLGLPAAADQAAQATVRRHGTLALMQQRVSQLQAAVLQLGLVLAAYS